MNNFNRLNTITGWIVFAIALLVYTLTMEPTVSFWDCGEFILASFKLEVVHPPGAPLFLLLGRFFTLFGPGLAHKAVMVNFLSALTSAFAMLFTFWIITRMAILMHKRNGWEINKQNAMAILGAGVVGALSATFLDSFWFSAVEGEVYASSAMFSMLMIWLMFKWEKRADDPYAWRYLVLIGLISGLAIGVHWLHLLTFPALVFIYYFRKYPQTTTKGILIGLAVSAGILGFFIFGVLDWVIRIGAYFDYIFVNNLGLPFWSGFIFFFMMLVAGCAYMALWANRKNKTELYIGALSFLMILFGMTTFTTVVIRAGANPPINMNAPQDPFAIHAYIKRDQYGHRPLFYGNMFTAQPVDNDEVGVRYGRGINPETGKEEYVVLEHKIEPVYGLSSEIEQAYRNAGMSRELENLKEANKKIFFPRIGSMEGRHVNAYRTWMDLKPDEIPTYGDNLEFFFEYQMGYMYMRYFLWNFAGRQDDIQGHIETNNTANGNWITGFDFIDHGRLSYYDNPESKNNQGRNKFYLIPLALGIIGMLFHFRHDKRMAWVIVIIIFFLGIMNLVNSNEPPFEPRERDYALAISFIAFAMWLGFGALQVYHWLREKIDTRTASWAGPALCLIAPLLLAWQGWDDHDRSDVYMARDSAINYLESLAPNAIVFTQGDNDTYPLWYVQEVEGIRTDVRVINLSLLAVDWYIEQLRNTMNNSPAINLSFSPESIVGDKRQVVFVEDRENFKQANGTDINKVLAYVQSDNATTMDNQQGKYHVLPTRNITMKIDQEKVREMDFIPAKYKDRIAPELNINLGKGRNQMLRDELIIMDIIANNLWERPLYFAITVPGSKMLGLGNYTQLEGMGRRLMPINFQTENEINTDIMYENIMTKWKWGGLDSDKNLHLGETGSRTAAMFRNNMTYLAQALSQRSGNNVQQLQNIQSNVDMLTATIFRDNLKVDEVDAVINPRDSAFSDERIMPYLKDGLSVANARLQLEQLAQLVERMRELEDVDANNDNLQKATTVLDKAGQVFDHERVPFTQPTEIFPFINIYYVAGDSLKGNKYADILQELLEWEINYIAGSETIQREKKARGDNFLRNYVNKDPRQIPTDIRLLKSYYEYYANLIQVTNRFSNQEDRANRLLQEFVILQREIGILDPNTSPAAE